MTDKPYQNQTYRERMASETHGEFAAEGDGKDGKDTAVSPGYIDLPFESGSADPQPLEYADLPDKKYDPNEDFRVAQARQGGKPGKEEGTDGGTT